MFLEQKGKTREYLKLSFFTLLILFGGIYARHSLVLADDFDDRIDEYCDSHTEEECEDFKEIVDSDETEYDNWENQLKNTEKLLKLTQEKSKTLNNQVQILNLEINGIQSNINSLNNEILSTQEKIDLIQKEIEKNKKNIQENQDDLGEMLRIYYKSNQDLGLSLISKDNSLSEIFTQSDNLGQISTKINNTLKIIREEKQVLDQEKETYEVEKSKLDNKKNDLNQEKHSVALKKNEKSTLLNRTQGEEAQYQALIAKIESQMKKLLTDVDSLTDEQKGELNEILKDADKPKYGLASTKWHYYQTDSKWKNDSLGGTSLTIGDYGCAITSIAMVFSYYDENVEPDDIGKRTSFFDGGGNIIWGEPADKYDMKLDSKYGTWHGNYDEDKVKSLVEDDIPVIVFIKGSSGGKGHYVVVHGYDKKHDDFVVHDPLWGPNLLLETSKDLIGSIYGRKAVVDQMIVYKPD